MDETHGLRDSMNPAAAASFGALLAVATGATAIGVAIVAVVGGGVALLAGRKRSN